MAHLPGNQNERVLAIYKFLPELERFLRETLAKEPLSEEANAKREEFLGKLENLNKPPELPPRGSTKPVPASSGYARGSGPSPQQPLNIPEQRAISWRMTPSPYPLTPAPYASKKRTGEESSNEESKGRPSLSSTTDDTIYEKIPSDNGSAKYIDLNKMQSDGKPPIPERSNRISVARPSFGERDAQIHALNDKREIFTRDLVNTSRSGPLRDMRTNSKNWFVLKGKKLYIFKDVQGSCSEIIDMELYDIIPQQYDFQLIKVGDAPLVFAAEDQDDHTQWVSALEKCKYEDLDSIMPEEFKANHPSSEDILIEDPDYEMPIEVIGKMERLEQENGKAPGDVYVDMHGSERKISGDYVDPMKRSPFYESLENLTYDAELPPLPVSSGEEGFGENLEKVPNGGPAVLSDDSGSGTFDSPCSSNDDELDEPGPPALPPRLKERSSTDPPPYNVNNTYVNSLDRKISNSLGRKFEREVFFNDMEALHVGLLHQRRVLAVWQKRYCKVKNDSFLVYRNPDKDEKPALDLSLHGLQFVVCDKETWRSHSFKITLPSAESYYFAAETHQQLVTWLDLLVRERERLRSKDATVRDQSKDFLNVTNDPNDSGSASSSERRHFEGSDSDAESIEGADSEASDQDEPETDRRKFLKKRSSFLKSQSQKRILNQEFDIDGNLYVERSGKWQRYWCKIESTKMEFFTSQSSKSAEFSLALLDSSIATAPVTAADERSRCIVKVTLNESETVLLARDQRECKKWMTHLKKYAKKTTENAEIANGLPEFPVPGKGKSIPRSDKNAAKNHTASLIDISSVAQDRKIYYGQLVHLKEASSESEGEVFCEIRGGFFAVASDKAMEQKVVETPVRKVRIDQKVIARSDVYVIECHANTDWRMVLGVKEKPELNRLIEALWLQNAQIEGDKGTVVSDIVNQLKKQFKRRSITFDPELKDMEPGDRLSLPRYQALQTLTSDRAASDSEQIGQGRRKTSKAGHDARKPMKQGSKQSSGSRMSAFFRSLPKRKHKKYDLTDAVDGMPKTQFNGTVAEVRVDENGAVSRVDRHCKVSGKIFYAYEDHSGVKPVFKVPLRSSTIEDIPAEKPDGKPTFVICSMEDKKAFKFEVETEEEFENWYNALYMIDPKSNQSKISSIESLLDGTKSDVDADLRPDASTQLFSPSNSNSSLSSVLSKQAKSIAGSGDESKTEPPRKLSEDVFVGGPDVVKHSGFLYEVKLTETNGIKSRTKLRRWCVLRQSWVEVFNNKNDNVPIRGIAIGHHIVEPISLEDSGEKWAMVLRSEEQSVILCANNEEDFSRWQQELKRVTKKRSRRSSDSARSRLKSASEGIKQLLSASSLPGVVKRDSKRNTIVLDEVDEKLVHDFTTGIESGNKISGVLTITHENEKVLKPKKRFCLIRDGKFCIAKRSKLQKFIKTIDLSKVAILDESVIEKGVFGFRLDFGSGENMAFQAADQSTADNWMVAISMAILLEKLTSPDKFPQQGEQLPDLPETDDNFDGGVNNLGLVDVSPVMNGRSSESSNLSNDIKAAIDHKISVGSSYLNPLSNLLESAFTPGPYSEPSNPSSREGTLEKEAKGRNSQKESASEAILEDERESWYEGRPMAIDKDSSEEHEAPRDPGGAPETSETRASNAVQDSAESVFDEAINTQIETNLADLLKKQEDLEKELNVILSRLPDLRTEVELARVRKERGSESTERHILDSEYDFTKNDLARMERRMAQVEKEIHGMKIALQKKASKLKDPFRRRSAVISPHVIV